MWLKTMRTAGVNSCWSGRKYHYRRLERTPNITPFSSIGDHNGAPSCQVEKQKIPPNVPKKNKQIYKM